MKPSAVPHAVVVGSLNVDLIARVKRLPKPGQTIASTSLLQRFGGKGANQAVALARQGARVSMIGCLGDDASGMAYRRHLRKEGIHDGGIVSFSKTPTGTALIAVDGTAENMIIVAAGANGWLKPAHVRAQAGLLAEADMLLLQWEVPQAAVLEALKQANRHDVPVVMNPSPWREDFPWGRHAVHTLIVNEGEAHAIFGRRLTRRAGALSKALASYGVQLLVITRGAESTLGIGPDGVMEVPTLPVTPIDTVGAGDAFAGTYTMCLAEGRDAAEAILYANAAGSLATLKAGAQEALPGRREVELALKRCR